MGWIKLPASLGHCRIKCNNDHGISNPVPGSGGGGGGGVRGNMQTCVVGVYKITYGESPFETLLSVFKLTPSLSQKTDQGHSLVYYNQNPQSSPGPSCSPWLEFPNPKQKSFPLVSFLANDSPHGKQQLLWSDSLLAETYFPGSYTHGPKSVLQPQRFVCLMMAPVM